MHINVLVGLGLRKVIFCLMNNFAALYLCIGQTNMNNNLRAVNFLLFIFLLFTYFTSRFFKIICKETYQSQRQFENL